VGASKARMEKGGLVFCLLPPPFPITPATRATFNGPHAENIRMSQEVLTHRLRSAVKNQCSDSVVNTEHGRPIQSIMI